MSGTKKTLTVKSIEEMRQKLHQFCEMQALLRDAVKSKMEEKDLSPAALARNLKNQSPRRIQGFLNGSKPIVKGNILELVLHFSGVEEDWRAEIEAITEVYGERGVTMIVAGKDGIDLFCDLLGALYAHNERLSQEEFSKIFGEHAQSVLELLIYKHQTLKGLFADEGEDARIHIKQVLEGKEAFESAVAALVEKREQAIAKLLREWESLKKLLPELSDTRRAAAEALGLNPSTFTNAFNGKKPYQLTRLRNVMNTVRAYVDRNVGESEAEELSEERGDERLSPKRSEPPASHLGSSQSASSARSSPAEPDRKPVVQRLTREYLRTLVIEDASELVLLAELQCKRLISTLQLILRAQRDVVMDLARETLEQELRDLHELIYLVSSAAQIEDLLEVLEEERAVHFKGLRQ